MKILSLEDLHVSYGAIKALRGVNLEVEEGEIVALIGSNGAGKTTTLKAISGLVTPDQGKILFDGVELKGMSPHRITRAGVAHVPEGRRIFGNLTVEENLRLAAYARRDTSEVNRDLERVLLIFPLLRERLQFSGATLSGGEQQMLAIARAILARGRLMLLDEPSMGLAPMMVREIFRVLGDINAAGTTLLLVEQNAHLALRLARRAYVMETGAVILSGPAATLAADPRVRQAYLGG